METTDVVSACLRRPRFHRPTDAWVGLTGCAEVGRGRHGNSECQDREGDPSSPFGLLGSYAANLHRDMCYYAAANIFKWRPLLVEQVVHLCIPCSF